MKNKLVIALIVCFMCLTMIFGAGCSMGGSSSEGGNISGLIEDPDTGDYDSGEEHMPASEAYSGFTIVEGTESDIQVADTISGTTMSFSAMVSRQIDKFVEDILARLNTVWGTGWAGATSITISSDSYALTVDGVTYYVAINNGDEILRKGNGSYTWTKADGTSVTISSSDSTFDITNPATFALLNAVNLISSNFSLLNAINGGSYWNTETSAFDGTAADSSSYDWTVSTGETYSLTADAILKTSLKLAIANILAYGQYNANSNLSECLADIDHLGFLQVDDEDDEVTDEVEKISDYILQNIIGSSALTKDAECLTALKSSLTNNILTSTSVVSALGHNYRGYALLVPEIVKTAVTNNFAITIAETSTVTYNENYLVYPELPKVTTENFIFPDSDEVEDFIWMSDYEEIKSITFMPKTDVPIVSFMLVFEAKGLDDEGEWQNITVQIAVTFTMVSGGKTVLDNTIVTGLGTDDNGIVTINPGVYDAILNENSANFDVSDIVRDAITTNTLPADAPTDIPSNGIVTVGVYDGHNPTGAIGLYGGDYTTYANDSGLGSVASLDAGNNYIQMNFSIVSATITQGSTVTPFTGTVMLRLAIGEPVD